MDPPDHHSLVDAIYAGILSPEGFTEGLQAVKEAFDVEMSYLLLWDRRNDLIRMVGASGTIPKFQSDYESHYQFEDPAKDSFEHIPVGDWWIDSDQIGPEQIKRSAFHQDFLRSYDMGSFMTSPVFRSADMEVAWGLLRARSDGMFSRARAEAIKPYVPHIGRAVVLRERMGELTSAAQLTQALLEHLPFGVAIIDSRLRILSLNNRGRTGLTALGASARWQHRMPGAAHSFKHMIREACKPEHPAPVQAANVRMPRHAPCKLLVFPLAAAHRFSQGWQYPAALAIFTELSPATRLLAVILRELYGLNRSEARLALSLADGSRLWTIADELHVTRETARTTLKAVFRKTSTNTQAQLVKLLAVLGAIDPPQRAP